MVHQHDMKKFLLHPCINFLKTLVNILAAMNYYYNFLSPR